MFIKKLVKYLSVDAKAARIAAGVSDGGIYLCQMCYIQQIIDYSIACKMLLQHWRHTVEKFIIKKNTIR